MKDSPNVLWIVTTQWRAQACGCAGDPNANTPCVDALASEGVNFTQAVTPHPFGPFARAAMLTGIPSPENGVRDYFNPLPDGARTLAHELAGRLYRTAFFGKWHLGSRDPDAPLVGESHAKTVVPPDRRGGFEFWEGFEGGFLLNDAWFHGTRLPEPVQTRGYQSDIVCSRAAAWIAAQEPGAETREHRPWFCVASLESPHPPYDAPAAGVVPADPASIVLRPNVPRGGELEARARRELSGYHAHIAATDRAIGRLVGAVPFAGTLVVFTSVHGDMHGSHGLFRKGWPHEESVRVPLIVRGPIPRGGATRHGNGGGEENAAAISLVDVPRLMLKMIRDPGFKYECTFSAISMPSVVSLPHQCDRVWRGIRTPCRKLVLNADGSPWIFIDLENDPFETRNLVDDPTRAEEIRGLASEISS